MRVGLGRRLATLLIGTAVMALLAACGSGSSNALNLGSSTGDLTVGSTTGALEARLLATDGSPMAGTTVQLSGTRQDDSTQRTLTSSVDGIVRAGNLPPGNYSLVTAQATFSTSVAAGQVTTQRFSAANPGQPMPGLGLLYCVNGLAKTLSVVDTASGAVRNNVLNLGEAPNQVVFHRGDGYVVNSVSNNVQIFNPASLANTGTVNLGDNANPWNILFVSDTRAYVSNLVANNVAIVDLAVGRQTTGTVSTLPDAGPQGMVATGGKLYVTTTNFDVGTFTYGTGRVVVIDRTSNQVTGRIDVGMNPQAVGLGADGHLYVVCTGDFFATPTSVYRINPATDQVVGEPLALTGEATPAAGGIAVAASGRAFLNDGNNGSLHVIDTTTGAVTHTGEAALPVGAFPIGVATTADGQVWAFNFVDDTASCYDAATLQPLFNSATGAPGSRGPAIGLGDGPQAGGGRQAVSPAGSLSVR